jgi:urease accessory protein
VSAPREGIIGRRVGRRAGTSRLVRLVQHQPLRALFPGDPDRLEAVLVNTGGGIVAGDRLRVEVAVDAGARLTVTTQAAEKVYRSTGPEVTVATGLAVGPGARLDWLPQETILFEHGRLRRELTLDLAADATFIGVEMLVFGRRARGEAFRWGCLHDAWDVRIDGRLVWADRLRVVPDATLDPFASPFALAGAAALATLVVRPPRLDLAAARAAIDGIDATLTVVGGLLLARLLHVDAHALRRRVVLLVTALRRALFACDEPMPRVWAI